MARFEPLFPECCHRCDHFENPSGNCGHPLDQTLRQEFVGDPNQPCPVDRN